MVNCEYCNKPIVGEVAKSMVNYHFACYLEGRGLNPMEICEVTEE